MWNLGVSLSAGPYLRDTAAPFLLPGQHIGDYREWVLGQDVSFAWHHLQLWTEFYETRFEVPTVGHVDTFAYYLEAKYKITPQLFGAVRWNQQLFGNVGDDGVSTVWGRDLWRIDTAFGYRFTAHAQLKLQYSFQQEADALHNITNTLAAQFTLRF
jgi:predicted porin